ncbi:MAG: helix-turn-helix domain-containing protein [Clostridiales bacterium]|nr:helix-turn-helix domain-containing protein [Clostridiales bacterium]
MLNENIKRLRTANNLTQVELAADLGVSKQCVSNWENDYIQPSIEMLIKIAQYFKVSTDFLLDLNDINQINVDGLSDKEIAHIRLIVEDLHNKGDNI